MHPRTFYRVFAVLAAVVPVQLVPAQPAAAQVLQAAEVSAPGPRPDKSGFTLFNPTPRELMREMSTDRPDTTESAYTVDAGHAQIELSFIDWTRDRSDGITTRTLAAAPVLLKVGLTNSVDLQLGLDPYTWVRSGDPTADAEGFGDTVLRLKVNLFGNDDGGVAMAMMPFLKFPTAVDGLGNGNIEGGVIIPVAFALPADFSLGVMAEFDFVRNGADDRYVVDFVHTATISHDLIGDLAGYLEYAGFANLSHDEEYRAYFDAGLTYALTDNVVLDGGVRVGLTDAADDLGLFAGISVRF